MIQGDLPKLKARAEVARRKIALLHERTVLELSQIVGGEPAWQPASKMKNGTISDDNRSVDGILFSAPMVLAHRFATPSNATSFHFKQTFINKVATTGIEGEFYKLPSAAMKHNTYVECETAVAIIPIAVAPDLAIAATLNTQRAMEDRDSVDPKLATRSAINQPFYAKENENDRIKNLLWGRSERASFCRSFLQPYAAAIGDYSSRIDPKPETYLCLLSGVELVRRGSKVKHLMRGASGVPMDPRNGYNPLRYPTPSSSHNHANALTNEETEKSYSERDRQAVCGNLITIQPDSTRVLFTNIDADPHKRAEFWQLVDKHERKGGPDQMSCRFADEPDFWKSAVQHTNCPVALQLQYQQVDHSITVRFDIDSGRKMRAFLATQAGWIAKRKRRPDEAKAAYNALEPPFAKLHDARSGRTQYRLVGELPNELTMAGQVQLLHDFTEEFRRRKLPFVAAMHAPDHKNHRKNWHIHLNYYHRPCARINTGDIARLDRERYSTTALKAGLWDFTVVTYRLDRVNRLEAPLRQNKVAAVGNKRWIKDLRHSFALLTNAQLEKEGANRRVDPRNFVDMGINAAPQEHLGTRRAAAETRGIVTAMGTANEGRQSRAIEAAIDAQHEITATRISEQIAVWQNQSIVRSDILSSNFAIFCNHLEYSLRAAAALDHISAHLRHDIARAESRAQHVQHTNRKIIEAHDAYDAHITSRSLRDRAERVQLVEAASKYLDHLRILLEGERRLIAECEAEAKVCRDRDVHTEANLTAELKAQRLMLAHQASIQALPRPRVELVVHDSAADKRVDKFETFFAKHVEEKRPLIVIEQSRFQLHGLDTGTRLHDPKIQARLSNLYDLQQADIAILVAHLQGRPSALRKSENRPRYIIFGVPNDLKHAFQRYQQSIELADTIGSVLRLRDDVSGKDDPLDGAGERATTDLSNCGLPARSFGNQTAGAAASGEIGEAPRKTSLMPTLDLVPAQLPKPAPASASANEPPTTAVRQTKDIVSEPLPTPVITMPAPFVAKLAAETVESNASVTDPKVLDNTIRSAAVDLQKIVQELIVKQTRLTIANDHCVDRGALEAANVDRAVIEKLRQEPLLISLASGQVEAAFAGIKAHLILHPEHITELSDTLTIKPEVGTELIEVVQYHAGAPIFAQKLTKLYAELHPTIAVSVLKEDQVQGWRSLIERHPERFSTIEPDLELRKDAGIYAREVEKKREIAREVLKREDMMKADLGRPRTKMTKVGGDLDILHGDAARQAARQAALEQAKSR